jgi:CheY-like chemotaxis protein
VLVAEDNGLLRRLLELQLAELGCAVRSVADGDEAVEAWRAERPDAVLLDLAMPRMGGLEAARRIRAEAGAPGVPWIVGLSAHASALDREAGLGAGMNRFLAKPADLAALAAALAREAANEVAAPEGKPVTETMTGGLSERLRAGFCAETPALLAALSVAAARGDGAEAAKRAHYLRSSALVLGDAGLEEACRRCEEAARAGDAVRLRATAEGVAREARRLLV